MTRYFFHVWDGDDCAPDGEGADFDSDEAARQCAITSARELLEEAIRQGRIEASFRFEVEREDGGRLQPLPFGLTVTGLPADPTLRTSK